jgi:hypothetical protein
MRRAKKCIQNFGQETEGEETSWEVWHRAQYITKIDLKRYDLMM